MSPKLTRKYSVSLIFIHPLRCATLQVKSNIRFVMQIFHLVPDIYVMAYFKCIEGNCFRKFFQFRTLFMSSAIVKYISIINMKQTQSNDLLYD